MPSTTGYGLVLSNGSGIIYDLRNSPFTYEQHNNWADFYGGVQAARMNSQVAFICGGSESGSDIDTEFRIVKESDHTVTVYRKHYVDGVFHSYVTVEAGFTSDVAAIERVHFIYLNGTPDHQAAIGALSVSKVGYNNC